MILNSIQKFRRLQLIEQFLHDVRYFARTLRKHRGFAVISIITLALGIGANTTIFSAINATLLRKLPFKDPDQLVMVWGTNPGGFGWRGKSGFSAASFLDYKEQNQVFQQVATFNSIDFTLVGTDSSERVFGGSVTPDFFQLLAVQPILGRTFVGEDAQAGRNHVVVLSHSLWQRHFRSDSSIVGQTIQLDAIPYQVIGVLPDSFDFSIPEYFETRDLWTPAVLTHDEADRGHKYLSVIARLKPGVSLTQAEQNMQVVTARLAQAYPATMSKFGVMLTTLREQIVGDVRRPLLLLFGSVGFVLLIACANVASLQLARASTRQREIAIRRALGASRARLIRQLLTENILLSLIGGTLGLLLAFWGIKVLNELGQAGILHGTVGTIDVMLFGYAFVLSVVTGILSSLAPALQSTPKPLVESLKEGARESGSTSGALRLRKVLTLAEVSLSVILLTGAGLLIRSFIELLRVNPGFVTDNILTARFYLPKYSYPDAIKQTEFYTQLMERLKGIQGVASVGATDELPLNMGAHTNSFSIEGHSAVDDSDQSISVQDRLVSADYFRTMGIGVVSGRGFSDDDNSSAVPVAIVNQRFADRFFPGQNTLGQRLRFDPKGQWITIVGVVTDVRGFGLDKQAKSEIYLPYQQQRFLPFNPLARMNLVIRTHGDANAMAAAVIQITRDFDKNLPSPQIRTMELVLKTSLAERRANMILLGAFAFAALVLTGVGIFGVISYSATQRTQEMGIRIALGAQRRDVLELIIGQGMRMVGFGVALGVLGAIALTRLLTSLLFEVSAYDPLTFVAVTLLLSVVSLVACYIPARRVTRVDPLIALRCE